MTNLSAISVVSVGLPAVLAVFFFQKNRDSLVRLYFLFEGIKQAAMLVVSYIIARENIVVVNLGVAIDVIILFCICLQCYGKPIKSNWMPIVLLGSFMILMNSWSGWLNLNRGGYLIGRSILMVVGLIILNRSIDLSAKDRIVHSIWKRLIFWFAIGIVIYNMSSILIFTSVDIGLVSSNEELIDVYRYIHPVINILCNIMFCFGIIVEWKTKSNTSLA